MIAHSESLANLAPALSQAQSEIKGVEKGGYNNHFKYSYAQLQDFIKTIRSVLKKHGLSIVTKTESSLRQGDITTVTMTGIILHTSGEWIEVGAIGEGQDKADKAAYKAQTGAAKYLIRNALNLATTDDPEEAGVDKGLNTEGLLRGLEKLGVGVSRIETYLGHSVFEMTQDEYDDLIAKATAIKNGKAMAESVFPARNAAEAGIKTDAGKRPRKTKTEQDKTDPPAQAA